MTMILLHLNGTRFARVDIDPASITLEEGSDDFPQIKTFSAQLFELPGPIVSEGTFLGTLLDRRPQMAQAPWTLTVSCGPSASYEIRAETIDGRVQPVIDMQGSTVPVDSLRLVDLLDDDQKHFATRVPRHAG